MRVVNVDEKMIKILQDSGLSKKMKSLEYCTFLVIDEYEGKIIGASGIGGLINNHSLVIVEQFQGKGLGKKLFQENINEAKRRKYSFMIVSRNPRNSGIIKLHDFFCFKPLFKINYSVDIESEVLILPFNKKGYFLSKFLRIFNTRLGMVLLAIAIKISKSFFSQIFTLTSSDYKDPNIKYIMSHFEKF